MFFVEKQKLYLHNSKCNSLTFGPGFNCDKTASGHNCGQVVIYQNVLLGTVAIKLQLGTASQKYALFKHELLLLLRATELDFFPWKFPQNNCFDRTHLFRVAKTQD